MKLFYVRASKSPERHLNAVRQELPRQFVPLNCRAIALTAGTILDEGKNSPSLVAEVQFGRLLGGISQDDLGEGNCESKNCRETVGESFFAARPLDVSQGPLGSSFGTPDRATIADRKEATDRPNVKDFSPGSIL